MTELLTLSLRESSDTLRRKLILSACIHITADAAPPVDLVLHSSLTREQDPKILELLRLGQDLLPDPEIALHPFPVDNHGLRFSGADVKTLLLLMLK